MKHVTEDLSPHMVGLMAAIDRYRDARSEGATVEEAAAHELEPALRTLLPSRGVVAAPVCALCDDTGFRVMICDYGLRCGRKMCAFAAEDWEHTYVEDCLCEPGQTRRLARDAAAARRRARAQEDDEPPRRGRRRR
jgi:hypothetical protein